MLRWFIFIFGGLLLITTLFLGDYRARYVESDAYSMVIAVPASQGTSLIRLDLDGQQTPLFDIPAYALSSYQWSKDGQWLLVAVGRGQSGYSKIYKVNRFSFSTQRIFFTENCIEDVSFSPDGSEIAFYMYPCEDYQFPIEVVRIDIDGHELARYEMRRTNLVTTWWGLNWLDSDTLEITEMPANSAHHIHTVSNTIDTIHVDYDGVLFFDSLYTSPNRQWQINVDRETNSHTLNLSRLNNYKTEHITPLLSLEDYFFGVYSWVWSDDSQWVAIWAFIDDGISYVPPRSIFIIRLDGTDLQQLTEVGMVDSLPLFWGDEEEALLKERQPFSPQNQWIAYTILDRKTHIASLNVIRTDGSGEKITNLFEDNLYGYTLRWTPHQQQILHLNRLLFGGLGLLTIFLSLSVWQWRQKRA